MSLEREESVDCADVVLRLFEYVDNEAAEEDGRRIQQHLDACEACLRDYERQILLKALVRRACTSEPAPEALRASIMARITTISLTRRSSDPGMS